MDAINLNKYIIERAYPRTETFNQTEVLEAIKNASLVQVVSELPTTEIRYNQLYLVLNNKDLDETTHNQYDLYLYVKNDDGSSEWERLDSLEFNIEDYYDKLQTDLLLNTKAETIHGHNRVTLSTDGFMSREDKVKLDTYPDEYIIEDNVVNSDNPVKSKAILTALNNKATTNHASNTNTYGLSTNTLYGHSMASSTIPLMDNGNGSIGTELSKFARADHVHPTDTSRASTAPVTLGSAGLMTADMLTDLNNIKTKVSNVNFNNFMTSQEVQELIDNIDLTITIEDSVEADNDNPVKSSGIKEYVDNNIVNIKIDDEDLLTNLNNIVNQMKTL